MEVAVEEVNPPSHHLRWGWGGGVREGEVALPRFQQPKSTRCRHQALKGCTQHLDRRRRASGRKRRPDPCAACPVRMFSSLKPCRCLPHQVATSSARQRRAQRPVPIRIALSSRPDSPAKPRPMVWPAHPCEARGVEQRPIRSPGLRGGVASDSTGRSRLGPNGRLRTCRNSPYCVLDPGGRNGSLLAARRFAA